jgi:iron complex transport system substrate-binding protein
MRIVSLVPHATELLFALGLGDQVVGVTHECDHPAEARERERVTRDRLPPDLDAAGIDQAVRDATLDGDSIYELDEDRLYDLQPDLIVTQALCAVCAVSYDDVQAIARQMDPEPQVVSLDPKTYGETLGDVRTVATVTDTTAAGVDLVARTRRRVDAGARAVKELAPCSSPGTGRPSSSRWPAASTSSASPASTRSRRPGRPSRRPNRTS